MVWNWGICPRSPVKSGPTDQLFGGPNPPIDRTGSGRIQPIFHTTRLDPPIKHRFTGSYPHLRKRGFHSRRRRWGQGIGAVTPLFGVDELPDGSEIAPQLLVLLGFSVDLVARMQDRGVVTAAELLADAQQ
ncbi:MAG: hypothetical protein QOJ81_500 [Chloroflexota bacterium]|nr:hypothetical protein [Chloroflexota bacterium]